MPISVDRLKVNHFYHTVRYVDNPIQGVVVTTWVYLEKRADEHAFVEWNIHFNAANKSAISKTWFLSEKDENGKYVILDMEVLENLPSWISSFLPPGKSFSQKRRKRA